MQQRDPGKVLSPADLYRINQDFAAVAKILDV
jgi:hypothetical protein